MSRGDRGKLDTTIRIVFALVFAILSAGLIWTLSAEHTQSTKARSYAKEYAEEAENRIAKTCVDRVPAAFAKCAAEIVKANRESYRAEYDLRAQEETADWTFWAVAIGLAQFIVSGIGLWAIVQNLRQNDQTIAHSRQSFETENRAWLNVNAAFSNGTQLNWVGGKVEAVFDVVACNVGKTVAKEVYTGVDFALGRKGAVEAIKKMREQTSPIGIFFLPEMLFPNEQTTPVGRSTDITSEDIASTDVLMNLHIVAYAHYRTIFDADDAPYRFTARVFDLSRLTLRRSDTPVFFQNLGLRPSVTEHGNLT